MHNWEELLAWKRNKILHTEPRGRSVSHGRLWSPRVFLVKSNFSIIYQIYFSHVCVCVCVSNDPKVDSEHAKKREINYLLTRESILKIKSSNHFYPPIVKRIFFQRDEISSARMVGVIFVRVSVTRFFSSGTKGIPGQSRKANIIATRRRRDAARRDAQRLLCRRDNHWPLNLFQEG